MFLSLVAFYRKYENEYKSSLAYSIAFLRVYILTELKDLCNARSSLIWYFLSSPNRFQISFQPYFTIVPKFTQSKVMAHEAGRIARIDCCWSIGSKKKTKNNLLSGIICSLVNKGIISSFLMFFSNRRIYMESKYFFITDLVYALIIYERICA